MRIIRLFVFFALLLSACMSNPFKKNHSGLISIKGNKIYYEEEGKGDAIIFVHAGFQDHSMWDEQVDLFSKNHRVITFDLPGHGKTKVKEDQPNTADLIRVLMDTLGVKKASFVGLSLGSVVVTDFATTNAARVNKIVLASPGLDGWDEEHKLDTTTRQYLKDLYGSLSNKDTSKAAEVFTHYWFDGLHRTPKTVDTVLRKQLYTTTLNTMREHQVSNWPKLGKPTSIHRLNQIKAPVLILTGELDLVEVLRSSEYLVKNVTGAKQIVVPEVAHMINLEKPTVFNDALQQFFIE